MGSITPPRIKSKISVITTAKLKPVPEKWEYFARLCQIKSGNKIVQFNPFNYQIKFSNLMDKHNNFVVVKSRQLGITQLIVSKFLHRAILNPGYSAMVFLKNQEDSSNIARRARVMLTSIPDYAIAENDNLLYLKIKNGGEIFFKNSAREGGRSYDSISDFLYDEAAFSPNIEHIYASSSASSAMVGDATNRFIISTPSAKFGWYWDRLNANNGCNDIEELCQKVVNGEIEPFYHFTDNNGDCKVIIHWRSHPIYSQRDNYLEYRQKQDGTSWEVVNREYNLSFVDTDVAVFSSEIIRKNIIETEINRVNKAKFYMGIDTANLGNDYTVAVVLMLVADTYYLIDMYRKRKQNSEYDIFKISELLSQYKFSGVGVEVTGGTGQIYLEQLAKEFKSTEFEAIRTTGDSKPGMVDRLNLALEKGVIKYHKDSPLIEELLTFRRVGNKLEASTGKHDDCVMAVCFALAVSPFKAKKNPYFGFTSINLTENNYGQYTL